MTVEPVVREPAAHNPTDTGFVRDLAVRGLWSSQTEALIDCRIVNTDAQSYAHRSVKAVLESTVAAKKTKHRRSMTGVQTSLCLSAPVTELFIGRACMS